MNRIVVLTGSHSGIGKCIAESFKSCGDILCGIDICSGEYFTGDIGKKDVLESFANKIIIDYEHVDIIINNAPPENIGIDNCSYENFQQALNVGILAPFYLVKLLKPYLNKNACIINISSTRENMSMPQTESYTAAKGGIATLTHSLAISLSGIARVNSISPGWISNESHTGSDALQHPVQRVGKPSDIANAVIYLCSEQASFINASNIVIDGGMSKQMIYHGDNGWELIK